MPPSVPIARKRGRLSQLRAAVPKSAPALDERRDNLVKAPNIHQQGVPAPTGPSTVSPEMPQTVPPGMPPTIMQTAIHSQLSDAVQQAVAPAAPESSDARRVFTRTTKVQPFIRFGHTGYVISNRNFSLFIFERSQCLAYTFVEQHGSGALAYIRRSGALEPMGARNTA